MKTIVITGASGGVGAMLAQGLAEEGHRIICLGRNEQRLKKVVNDINSNSHSKGPIAAYKVVDMMEEQLVGHAAERIRQQFNTIDVWINNVGVNNHNAIGPTWELEAENWWTEVSLNLYTAFLGTRTAINLMKDKGSGYIINLGGGGVQDPKPFGSAYGAAKTAIVKFTETINIELEQEGLNIKVFAINPGFIRNKRTETLVESDVARKYMPELEQILKHGKMSDIRDTLHLIEALISGKADELGGRYFLADDQNIDHTIEDREVVVNEKRNLLRIRQ